MTVRYNILLPLLLLISATITTAQEDERWYRIELLIFTHQSQSAQNSETWEATPDLVYPAQSRFLIDPALVDNNLALFDATSTVDELGQQTLTIIPPPLEDEADDNAEEAPEQEQEQEQSLPGSEESPEEPEEVPEEELPATPSPFIVLPSSELEFRGKAAYMQRTGRYQTLFHKTWVQAIADESNALPLIIDRSGDMEEWPQLQGSVKFFLSRYLHLETNLWLNTPGNYLPQGWQMPAAPLGPKSLTIIYPPEPEPEIEEEPEPIESGFFAGTQVDPMEDGEDELLEPVGPVYPWGHAVLLQQKRKMRSTELHYIDHPMLGLVVKITPVEEEELQARAVAEAEVLNN